MLRRPASALIVAGLVAAGPVRGDEVITVTGCPGARATAVTFRVDCSHVREGAARAQCKSFIENQACKVFPAYRDITGIELERACPVITYTLYDKDQWPHKGGDAGGFAGHCSAELMSDYSVLLKSSIGPYDTHELLHVYQQQLGALPAQHILFGSSQLEARRLVGDKTGYLTGLARLKQEALDPRFEEQFGRLKPEQRCPVAQETVEERLYVSNPKAVYAYYRKLKVGWLKDQADREARFNRMFDQVSEGTVRQFLLDHGCAAWRQRSPQGEEASSSCCRRGPARLPMFTAAAYSATANSTSATASTANARKWRASRVLMERA
jgi:hypothetical protein